MLFKKYQCILGLFIGLGCINHIAAQDLEVFRIGTGGPNGTYYPIGKLISQGLSESSGSSPCTVIDSCEVKRLLAVPQISNGSTSNISDVSNGKLEAGFAQSDIAFWAYSGTGVMKGRPKVTNLRAIARLYTEHVHIVTRKDLEIRTLFDLEGKKVSVDEPGSGTMIDSELILNSYGISFKDMNLEYIKPTLAAGKLKSNALDAFFIIGGYPISAISNLSNESQIGLVPISGAEQLDIVSKNKFFSSGVIPENVYKGIGKTETISVGAILITSSDHSEETIYQITKALWSSNTARILQSGHRVGKNILIKNALENINIPLHKGALKFYSEIGLIE